MEARAKIEEDLFTRVPLSKTERRRAKATTRSMNALAQVGDFGDDVADLVEVAEELEGRKRQRLVDAVSAGPGAAAKAAKPASGEQDVPLRDSLGVRCPLARDEPHDDDGCFDCFDHDFDDGFDATCVGLSLASFEASMTRLPWLLGVKYDATSNPARVQSDARDGGFPSPSPTITDVDGEPPSNIRRDATIAPTATTAPRR